MLREIVLYEKEMRPLHSTFKTLKNNFEKNAPSSMHSLCDEHKDAHKHGRKELKNVTKNVFHYNLLNGSRRRTVQKAK